MKALAKARKGMNEKLIAVWTYFFWITLKYKTFSSAHYIWKDRKAVYLFFFLIVTSTVRNRDELAIAGKFTYFAEQKKILTMPAFKTILKSMKSLLLLLFCC